MGKATQFTRGVKKPKSTKLKSTSHGFKKAYSVSV